MRAKTAFVRWAAPRVGGPVPAAALWIAAVGGDGAAAARVFGWLADDDLHARLAKRSDGVKAHRTKRAALCAALACFSRILGASGRLVSPAQIAVARYGDFSVAKDASGVVWKIRRCGSRLACERVLTGADLEAWRAVVRWGRIAHPVPEDRLLALRSGGRFWDARAVRYAIQCAGAAAGGESGSRADEYDGGGAGDASEPDLEHEALAAVGS